jgi:cytochrome c
MKKVVLSIAILLAALAAAQAQTKIPPNIQKILQKNTCLACHNPDTRLVGPAYKEVMKKKKDEIKLKNDEKFQSEPVLSSQIVKENK